MITETFDKGFALAALLFKQFCYALVGLWLKHTKGQILEFPLQQTHAETVGQWREYVQRLLRNSSTLFVIIVLK